MTLPDKASLRTSLLAARRAIPPAEHAAMCARICERALTFLIDQEVSVIAGFAPLAAQAEPDIWKLMAGLYCQNIALCLPAAQTGGKLLEFRRYVPGEVLSSDIHNVPAPPPEAEILSPTLVLVPFLGIDKDGYRLGYGGGYYDATLAYLRIKTPELMTVGIGFSLQILDHPLPREPHDQRLDLLVTEDGIRSFT